METAVNFELDCTLRSLWQRGQIPDDLERYVRQVVRRLAGCGIDRINWRCMLGGKAMYRSKVLQPFDGHYALYAEREAELLRQCDPLEVIVDECGKSGVSPWGWLDAFDSYVPGLHEAIFERNPSWLLWSKDGMNVLPGVGCYANRAFCNYRNEQFQELSGYGLDGVLYSLFNSHAPPYMQGALAGTWPAPYSYGYNPEIVQAFQVRYGVDIRHEAFDVDAWAMLQAEQFGAHLAEIKHSLHRNGQKLSLVIRRDNHVAGAMYPACYIANAYDKWYAQGCCDELIIEGVSPGRAAVEAEQMMRAKPDYPWGIWRTIWAGGLADTQQVIDWAAQQPALRTVVLHEVDALEADSHSEPPGEAYARLAGWAAQVRHVK